MMADGALVRAEVTALHRFTAMAPTVLRERVGWHRWSAVILGFIGVIVMLKPTGEGLQWATMLPVAAAFFGATRDVITRRMSAGESRSPSGISAPRV